MRRRALLLAMLLYVTLDLSLAEMPGAFVFDVSDSVVSIQTTGARSAPERVARPAPPSPDVFLPSRLPLESQARPAPIVLLERRARPGVSGPSRAPDDPPASSEDPH